jgi:prevent-host-death family protein
MRDASVKEAKNTLTGLIRVAEQGIPIRLTRRGKPVAVLLSLKAFERRGPSAAAAVGAVVYSRALRAQLRREGMARLGPKEFANLRDPRPGREVLLPDA